MSSTEFTIDDFINFHTEDDDHTARLHTIKFLCDKLREAFVEEGRTLHEIDGLPWSRIGGAIGTTEKMAAYHFGTPEQVGAWKQRNREGARKRRELLAQATSREEGAP